VTVDTEPHVSRTQLRRRRLGRRIAIRGAALALALGLAAGIPLALSGPVRSGRAGLIATEAEGQQVTYLVFLSDRADLAEQASAITILAVNRDGTDASVTVIPTSTRVPIPGQGVEAIGKAMSIGGAELATLTVENLLGIEIDHAMAISPADASRLTGPRRLWTAAFRRIRAQPQRAAKDIREVATRGALDSTPDEVVEFFQALARAPGVKLRAAPVDPVGSGTFSFDEDRLSALVHDLFAGSTFIASVERPEVAVLNGVGKTGVGALVAARLVPAGMKIVVSGDAFSSSFKETLITIYDVRARSLARRIKRLLGVGRILMAPRTGSSVDAAVTVGSDFLREAS
jgi:3-oxoacyl-ACP reductase-like protein